MNGINEIVIAGRITKDPEIKVTSNGKNVCHFRLAVPAGKDQTDFIQCVAWEQNALYMERFVRKGAWVAVDGWLKQVVYQKGDKDVNSYEVVARQVVSPKQSEPMNDFAEVY